MAYLLDANVFIQAKNLHYGFDFCPAFWDWLSAQHAQGLVFSISQVIGVIGVRPQYCANWSKFSGRQFVSRSLSYAANFALARRFKLTPCSAAVKAKLR